MSNPTAQAVTLTQDPSVAEDGVVIKPIPSIVFAHYDPDKVAKDIETGVVNKMPLLMGDFPMLGVEGVPVFNVGGLACE